MRVTERFRDERGATAIVIGISLISLFGFATVAVDGGNLWRERRSIITATDAAALAAAQDYAVDDPGCTTAAAYITDNDADATMTGCSPTHTGSDSGYVTVSAESLVDLSFAPVIGFDVEDVSSSSTAAWGRPTSAFQLRPFGLCNQFPDFASWDGATESVPVVVPYTNEGTLCGEAPGMWDLIDLNGGSNSNAEFRSWISGGYEGEVSPGDLEGDPGALSGSHAGALSTIVGEQFAIPVFDDVEAQGANATYHVIDFVGVELVDFNVTGPQALRYLTFKFVPLVITGSFDGSGGGSEFTYAVRLCAVDDAPDVSNC